MDNQQNSALTPPPLFRAVRAGSAIGLSTIAALVAGFILQLTIAYKFGAGGTTDAYFMAYGTSELLSKILLGGSITSVFLPIFVEHLTRGESERAWRLSNNLIHLAAILFVGAVIILEIYTEKIVSFIAPGFSPSAYSQTVILLRIMLPAFFFTMLADLIIAILHSFRVFGIPALTRLFVPLLLLILILTASNQYGIYVLGAGVLGGATMQLVLILTAVRRAGYVYKPYLSLRDPDLRRVIILVAPFALSVLAAQGSGVVYRILVSHLPAGSLSALNYGEKIYKMANTLFMTTITTIAFPAFSRVVAEGIKEKIKSTMNQAVRIMVFFGVPLTIGIIMLRTNIVRLFYERGSFTPEDTFYTASVLGILLIGLMANGISSLLGHLALAFKVTHISVAVTIISHLFAIALFALLTPVLGVKGLALGSAITPFALAGLYVLFLLKRVPRLWSVFMDSVFLKLAVCGVALLAGVTLGRQLTLPLQGEIIYDLTTIISAMVLGGAAYLTSAWALKVPEIRTAKEIMYYTLRKLRPS